MKLNYRILLTVLLTFALTSCSWFSREEGCKDDEPCDNPPLLQKKPEKQWYCWGDEKNEWQCEQEPGTHTPPPAKVPDKVR